LIEHISTIQNDFNLTKLLNFIKNDEFINNKLFNNTKYRIISDLIDFAQRRIFNRIKLEYEEYIKITQNIVDQRIIMDYFKLNELSSPIEFIHLFEDLYNLNTYSKSVEKKLENYKEFFIINFIKEKSKNSTLFSTYCDIVN
jgi:hypothetical protein